MASLATDADSNRAIGEIESCKSQAHPHLVQERPSDISDEDENIVSEEEKDGYDGDIDNHYNIAPNICTNPSSAESEKSKRAKKNFADKKTRFISETKRANRIKQCAINSLSNTENLHTNSKMPIEINDATSRQQNACEELHFRNPSKTVVIDKLDLSSTSSSCDEGISNMNEGDGSSPNGENIPQSQARNSRKRKTDKTVDVKNGDTKKKKKHKGSHMRKH